MSAIVHTTSSRPHSLLNVGGPRVAAGGEEGHPSQRVLRAALQQLLMRSPCAPWPRVLAAAVGSASHLRSACAAVLQAPRAAQGGGPSGARYSSAPAPLRCRTLQACCAAVGLADCVGKRPWPHRCRLLGLMGQCEGGRAQLLVTLGFIREAPYLLGWTPPHRGAAWGAWLGSSPPGRVLVTLEIDEHNPLSDWGG